MKPQLENFGSDCARIKYEAERFLTGGSFDLYEDGQRVASFEPSQCRLDIAYGKAIFSCWNDQVARSWRVVSGVLVDGALQFFSTRQNGRVSCTVELRRGELRLKTPTARADFRRKMSALIETHLPGLTVQRSHPCKQNPQHGSSPYARFSLRDVSGTMAAIAISDRESQTNIDAALGAGLIWLDELRQRNRRVNRLLLFVPAGRTATLACRLVYMRPEDTLISLYEVDEQRQCITAAAAFAQGDLLDHLKATGRAAHWPKNQPLSPEFMDLLQTVQRHAARPVEVQRRDGWIYFAICGLTFARVSVSRLKVEFGLQPPRKKLTGENRQEFAALISAIDQQRRAEASARTHDMYRAQTERWLESVIRQDVSAIDPTLDARFAYSQVPAYRGEQRSFIDILTATRDGQLVVIELKVSEDMEFPFQGLDYWMRIDWHRRRGDFERRGYFQGLKLSDTPPLLYLIAPLFRFHATTGLLARAITRQVPVYRIGINEDWRSGVRVLLSERLNA